MNDSEFPTVIGSDAKFKGEFTFEKGAKILGDFQGSISSKGDLVVASQGAIQADIEAGNITIEGVLHGNIAAQGLVELKQTARLEGDLRCNRLIVGDGARFVGHCNVGNSSANKSVPPRPVTTPAPSTIPPRPVTTPAPSTIPPRPPVTPSPPSPRRPLDDLDMPE